MRWGANLLIVHEPTFYTSQDGPGWFEDFPNRVYAEKRQLLEESGIAIWRDHDHMHFHQPDSIFTGVLKGLGWEDRNLSGSQHRLLCPLSGEPPGNDVGGAVSSPDALHRHERLTLYRKARYACPDRGTGRPSLSGGSRSQSTGTALRQNTAYRSSKSWRSRRMSSFPEKSLTGRFYLCSGCRAAGPEQSRNQPQAPELGRAGNAIRRRMDWPSGRQASKCNVCSFGGYVPISAAIDPSTR